MTCCAGFKNVDKIATLNAELATDKYNDELNIRTAVISIQTALDNGYKALQQLNNKSCPLFSPVGSGCDRSRKTETFLEQSAGAIAQFLRNEAVVLDAKNKAKIAADVEKNTRSTDLATCQQNSGCQ